MADYGATDTSTTTLGANQFPLSASWSPGDALHPMGGTPSQTDSGGKKYSSLLTFPGYVLNTLSAWNSATALNATQNIFTSSFADAVLVQLTQTTTLTAGAITFEVNYDGSTWLPLPANCVLDPTSSSFAQISLPYTLQASTNKQFLLLVNGAQGLRIKLSTAITGTGAVTPNYALLPYSPLRSMNLAQLAGTVPDTNSGVKSAGTQRVVLATDQPALTNAQPTNITQWNGAAVSTSNPVLTMDRIRSLIAAGKGFRATTTMIATNAANALVGFQARAATLSVDVIIYRIVVVSSANCSDGRLYYNSTGANTDATLTANLLTSNTANQQVGGASPALGVLNASPASTTQTTGMGGTGATQVGLFGSGAQPPTELLGHESQIWLPKSTDRNFSAYGLLATSGGKLGYMIEWVEI